MKVKKLLKLYLADNPIEYIKILEPEYQEETTMKVMNTIRNYGQHNIAYFEFDECLVISVYADRKD